MTAQIPRDREHSVDLLPAYANGQLDAESARRVREHLVSCEACRLELAAWESIKGAANLVYTSTPLPSAHVMGQVWAQIDAPQEARAVHRRSPLRSLRRYWLIFRAQVPLIHKSIWIASALVCLLGLILILLMGPNAIERRSWAASLLVLFIVVTGASGSAFLYGSSVDPGFELSIATPTSVRFVMLCRMALVLGYNCLLGTLASAVFAIVYGGSLWGMVQLWFGPLLFLSSLCLAISLFISSSFAVVCTAVIESLQSFPTGFAARVGVHLPLLDLGPTSPALLIGALLLVVFAICFLPKQPKLVG